MHRVSISLLLLLLSGCPTAGSQAQPPRVDLERLRCAVATFIERCPSSAFAFDIQEPLLRVDTAGNFIRNFDDALTDPALIADAAAFDACIDSLANCESPIGRSACQLDRIFTGPDGEGDPCSTFSCGPGLGCVDGRCRPFDAEGDPCDLVCSGPDLTCAAGRCELLAKAPEVGDPCDGLCGPGLACIDGVCEAQVNAAPGEACDDYVSDVNALRYCTNQQAGATYCRRGQNDVEGVCASTPLPGEQCASTFLQGGVFSPGICRGGRPCIDDVCTDGSSATGEPCQFNADCALSDRCDLASSTCTRLTPTGAACTSTFECADGALCIDGVCSTPEPLCAQP